MKHWIWIFLAVLPFCAQAQAPDNERIDLAINNSASPYYYPPLIHRYRAGDETLTKEDYRHLYYGYMFQSGYDPHTTAPELDSMLLMIARDPGLVLDDYKRLVRFGEKVMADDPFNPRVLNIMTYAYGMMGDTENERKSALRFNGVIDAILSTGSGDRESSPWHILYFSHAEDVLDQFGLQYMKPRVISRTTEFFQLLKRAGRTRGYFFDFSRVYTRRPDQVPEQPREHRWQINDRVLK